MDMCQTSMMCCDVKIMDLQKLMNADSLGLHLDILERDGCQHKTMEGEGAKSGCRLLCLQKWGLKSSMPGYNLTGRFC